MNEILMFFMLMIMMKYMNFFILSNLMFLMSLMYLINMNWIKWILIFCNLGINYYSNYLILMMFWIFGLIFLNLKEYKKNCLLINLLLMFFMMLNFMSMELLIFYFMYETSLLLVFYMIMEWGYGEYRVLASFYLMFYTLVFSLPLLYFIYKIYMSYGSSYFFFLEFFYLKIDKFDFMYMMLSFFVKIPLYLIHGWLMKAHVEAPFFGSMILAAIMLKLGSYGLLRLILIFKFMLKYFIFIFMFINILGMLVLSLICLLQFDMKLIIALSSIIHMGIMSMGILTGSKLGIIGGLLMMMAHGLVSSGLFYLVNMIYEQTNSRIIFINKGMMNLMPSMSMMWFMFCIYNSGAPISLNMVSEIFLLMSLINWYNYLFILLVFYCLFSFFYSIYLFSFIQHGKIYNFLMNINNCFLMNYTTLILHLLPLNFLIFNLFFYLNSLIKMLNCGFNDMI
nr:TPA_asm: ND4 [Bombus difficillimus]